MKFYLILVFALFSLTTGCETCRQILQKREGSQLSGALEAAAYMAEVENVRISRLNIRLLR